MKLAPIVLFVYNRPRHTEQTLEALMANELAKHSLLFIYADGAKAEADEESFEIIKETRSVLRKKQWCKEVFIIESNSNNGLADSIINGVTEVVNKYGRAIILEDDIIISTSFLDFMNNALLFYENNHEIMHISGYVNKDLNEHPNSDIYTNQFTHCWGWATWQRAWRFFESDISILYNLINGNPNKLRFKSDLYFQLQENYNKRLKTWAVKWYASVFLRNGKCLHPSNSLIMNIGFDGSGTNCPNFDVSHSNILDLKSEITFPKRIPHIQYEANIPLFNKITNQLKKSRNRLITIDGLRKICKSALIEVKYGGQIYIGKGTEILEGVILQTYGGIIQVGKNCSINAYSVIYGHGGVKIGNNVLIAGHCMLIPANHIYENKNIPINEQGETRKGIVIEDDVWIGSGVKILDGVTIGKGAIIAAGAVVNRNVESFTIVGGVPAKKIKDR